METFSERNIDFSLICQKCGMERYINIPLSIPSGMYLGISQFQEILNQTTFDCSFCEQSGLMGDNNKFKLEKTSGLDDDLVPQISDQNKKDWYYELEELFHIFLKEIFDINEFENPGFVSIFYQCRFLLNKTMDFELYNVFTGVYKIAAVLLENGQKKTVEGKYTLLYDVELGGNLPEELIINPHDYTTGTKSIKLDENLTHPFSLLIKK